MTLPLFPLLLEIHYRCADSPSGRWIIADAAFVEEELETLQLGIEQGFIECDIDPGEVEVSEHYRLSLTDRARRQFGLPRPPKQPAILKRLLKLVFPRAGPTRH
jgi:hypothetical protein